MDKHKCPHCGQSIIYYLSVDAGTVHIVKQIAKFIGQKGINAVHPRKEMEGTLLTSNEVGNLTRARAHGLIAKIEGNAGNYCLTYKGSEFLNGRPIHKTAIMDKVKKMKIGFLEEDGWCKVSDFNSPKEYWEGIGYDIKEGNVIVRREPVTSKMF